MHSEEPSSRKDGLSALHYCRTWSPGKPRLESSEILYQEPDFSWEFSHSCLQCLGSFSLFIYKHTHTQWQSEAGACGSSPVKAACSQGGYTSGVASHIGEACFCRLLAMLRVTVESKIHCQLNVYQCVCEKCILCFPCSFNVQMLSCINIFAILHITYIPYYFVNVFS